MQKRKIIILSFLGILIIFLSILILIQPIVLKNQKEELEETVDKIEEKQDKEYKVNKGSILLGVNVLTTGDGINYNSENNTVTITKGGEYDVVGNFVDGQIVIDTTAEVKLILKGVNIKNSQDNVLKVNKESNVTLDIYSQSFNLIESEGSNIIETVGSLKFIGEGNLTLINNQNNGLNTQKGIIISGGNIFIQTLKSPVIGNFTINKGNVMTLSSTKMENINDKSTQNIMQVILPENLAIGNKIILKNSQKEELINNNVMVESNVLLISGSFLENGDYYLFNNDQEISLNNEIKFTIKTRVNNFD